MSPASPTSPDASRVVLQERLIGCWRTLSWARDRLDGGPSHDALGPQPLGHTQYGSDGRVMVLVLRRNRQCPVNALPTEAEKRALFESMFAYAGRYQIELDCVIHELDATWNERWTGISQIRPLRFDGERLVYTSPATVSPMDGPACTHAMAFERD